MTDSLKLTAYFGDRLRHGDAFVADELMALCANASASTSITMRGAAGFGPRHVERSDVTLSGSEDLPVAVSAVDAADAIMQLAGSASALISRGLLTLERIGADAGGGDVEVTCFLGRRQRESGQPAYRAVCDLLREYGFDGATVILGVDGTVDGQRRRARFIGANSDVPTIVAAVGSAQRWAAVAPLLAARFPGAALGVQRVQLCKRAGSVIAPPTPPSDAGWQRLTVHTSETDLVDGEPVHRALVRRLRSDPIGRGVTVIRGVWGFHGVDKPHGDKLFQFGRHVPVTTTIVDDAARMPHHFTLVDEVTAGIGVVAVAPVVAMLSIDGESRDGGLDVPGRD